MPTHTAPYGFVPLNEVVVHPDWAQPKTDDDSSRQVAPPLQDVPFEDGICGEIEVEITAETPIFIRGTGRPSDFFQLPDGRYAVPSTSMRGALRNVVEIASFSRMRDVNNHRYAVRDLRNRDLYGQFMSEIVENLLTGKKEPMPLVNAGWLGRVEGDGGFEYRIDVCDFAKIEYAQLKEQAQRAGVPRFDPGRKQSARDKYESWGVGRSREVSVRANNIRGEGPRLISNFGKTGGERAPQREGALVFTGQPVPYRGRGSKAKHHDFVFFDGTICQLQVDPSVYRDFEFAHSDRGQQNSLNRSHIPNEEWGFWEPELQRGGKVPVFFIVDDSHQVTALGLAMMFRLPYRNSIKDAVRNAQGDERQDHGLDFAEAVFGTVRGQRSSPLPIALKSRIDFSHAVAENTPEPMGPVTTILGGPKASYYPNYVEQDPARPGTGPRSLWTTWQDEGVQPRGWKRYRPHEPFEQPTQQHGRVSTTFKPLPMGTSFKFSIYVHNLRPIELGAILWALDFGGDPDARHALGMGRPLGYGRSKMRVLEHSATSALGESVQLDDCVEAFSDYMEGQLAQAGGQWSQSVQTLELVALARPVAPDVARYQILGRGRGNNEFANAKDKRSHLPRVSTGGVQTRRAGNIGVNEVKGVRTAQKPSSLSEGRSSRLKSPPPSPEETLKQQLALLQAGTAAQHLPELLERHSENEAMLRMIVEGAIEKLGKKWLKKKAGKAWLKPYLDTFAKFERPLS